MNLKYEFKSLYRKIELKTHKKVYDAFFWLDQDSTH